MEGGWTFNPALAESFAASLAALSEEWGEKALGEVRPFFAEILDAAADELGRITPGREPDPRFLRQIWIAREA